MSQRITSSAYGKAFLWLVAIAIALLVEGFLSQQFGGDEDLEAPQVERVEPGNATSLYVDRLAGGILKAVRLLGTLR